MNINKIAAPIIDKLVHEYVRSEGNDVTEDSEVLFYLGRAAGALSRKLGIESFLRGYEDSTTSPREDRVSANAERIRSLFEAAASMADASMSRSDSMPGAFKVAFDTGRGIGESMAQNVSGSPSGDAFPGMIFTQQGVGKFACPCPLCCARREGAQAGAPASPAQPAKPSTDPAGE